MKNADLFQKSFELGGGDIWFVETGDFMITIWENSDLPEEERDKGCFGWVAGIRKPAGRVSEVEGDSDDLEEAMAASLRAVEQKLGWSSAKVREYVCTPRGLKVFRGET